MVIPSTLLSEPRLTKFSVVLLAWLLPVTVGMATAADVLIAWVASPPYVAWTKAVVGGIRLVVAVTEVPESVKGPNEPRVVTPSLASAINETLPVAPAGVTVTVAEKAVPDGEPPVGAVSAVVVAARVTVDQLLKRFATFMDPKPVAMS